LPELICIRVHKELYLNRQLVHKSDLLKRVRMDRFYWKKLA